jgi:hypothetical protein
VLQQDRRNPWKFVTAEPFPRQCGLTGGEKENDPTWVRDLANGCYRLPRDEMIRILDNLDGLPG